LGYNRSGKRFRERIKRHKKMLKRLSEKESKGRPTAAAAPPAAPRG
jgi:hypothetical protein